MGKAIAQRRDDSRTPATVVENYFTEREARAEVSATVHKFMPRQLSQASGRSLDAAKSWIAGTRAPNLANIINMARSLPAVSEWLAEKCGWRAAQAMSADAVIRWAREYRAASGMDGDVARAVLRAVTGDEPEPVVTETIVRDSWKLQDKREAKAVATEQEKSAPRFALPKRRSQP